jgi:hypothetical protein
LTARASTYVGVAPAIVKIEPLWKMASGCWATSVAVPTDQLTQTITAAKTRFINDPFKHYEKIKRIV